MGVLKSIEPTGFLAFAPAFAGTNWADVNRRIIQNCPHGRGRVLSSPPLWFRLCRLRQGFECRLARVGAAVSAMHQPIGRQQTAASHSALAQGSAGQFGSRPAVR
jgi:hypothetical protein